MEVIRWDCGENAEQMEELTEFNDKLNVLKNKLNHYKQLAESNQITEYMFDTGKNELFEETAKLIQDDSPNVLINGKFKMTDDLSIKDKSLGYISCLCPQCNKLIEYDDKIIVNSLDFVGNRLILKTGKYGMFWGCSNWPNCTFSISTFENFKKVKFHCYLDLDDDLYQYSGDDIY